MVFVFQVVVDNDSSSKDPVVGYLKLENSTSENGSLEESSQEIQISLDKKTFKETWPQPTPQFGCSMNIVNSKSDVTEEIWGKKGKLSCLKKKNKDGKLDFQYLNPNRKASERVIFRGSYENAIEVAIERIQKKLNNSKFDLEIKRAVYVLKGLEIHENFIRYFSYETDDNFVYIATELCLCSVADLFDTKNAKNIHQEEILNSLSAKGILYQATRGLEYLHQNEIVHRNVKPSSFLVKEIQSRNSTLPSKYVVKISDFRLARPVDPKDQNLSGTIAAEGWIAPESKDTSKPLKPSLDVYILGCFYYFVLSGFANKEIKDGKVIRRPNHPFDHEKGGKINIVDKTCAIYEKDWNPGVLQDNQNALKLIKRMIKFEEGKRPTSSQVLNSDYFKPSQKEYYSIYNPGTKPGLCVIFNQEKFRPGTGLNDRVGSEMDWKELQRAFKSLGFDVGDTEIHHNLKRRELISEINQLIDRDYTDYGCLVVCLLSHGVENAIYGSDGKLVNTNEFQYLFSYKNCPSLYGKPKIFIIQACQGSLQQNRTGITFPTYPIRPNIESVVSTGSNSTEVMQQSENHNVEGPADGNPPIMDLFTIKATIPGFVSWRHTASGSRFIQALCKKLQEDYFSPTNPTNEFDLEEIIRGDNGVQALVNMELAKRRQEILEMLSNSNEAEAAEYWRNTGENSYQTIRSEVSLSKCIKLHKI